MRPALLLTLALLVAAPAQALEPGRRDAVAVYRGSEANVPPAIPILRGSSAHGSPSGAATTVPEASTLAVGGRRLWLVTPETGELVGCRLGGTTEVGVNRIHCTRRSLP